jgi:O-antigen/teichoic acid export membrane protein
MSRTDQVLHSPLNRMALEEPARSEARSPDAVTASLVRSSGTAIAGGLFSQALKAAVMIYVARIFGAADFGSFSFANSVNAFLFIIAQFGLPVFGAREVAQAGYLERRLLKAITEARLLLAVSGTVVALVVLYFVPGVTRTEFWLVAGFGLSNVALSGFFDWAFQGMGRLHLWATINIAWQALWLVFTIAAFYAHASIALVSFGFAAAALIAGMLGWPWLRRLMQLPGVTAAAPAYSMRCVIGASANLGAGTLLITVLVWTDTIIVRFVRGQQAAGAYAAGNRVALALAMLGSFYVLGAFPKLSQSAMNYPDEFSKYFQRVYQDLALLFIPGSFWAIAYAPQIMLVLFKHSDYLAGVGVFRAFQVILLLSVFSNLYGMGALVPHRRDRAYRKALLLSVVALLASCPVLTLRWGLEGAAIAVLLSQALCMVLFVAQTGDIVQAEHFKALGPPALIGITLVLAAVGLHLRFWSSIAALALAYLIILVWRRPELYLVTE